MRSNLRTAVIIMSVIVLLPRVSLADLTIKVRMKEGTQPESHLTLHFKGNRQRNEYESVRKSPAFAWLFQCDKRQFIGINIARQEYFINRLGRGGPSSVAFNENQLPPKLPVRLHSRGTVDQTVIVTDTGERREMFGFT